jgi:hypothetical protein
LSGRSAEADAVVQRLAESPTSSAADLATAGSVLISRLSRQGGQGDAVVRARKLFRQALERDPSSLQAIYGYGLTQVIRPDDLEFSMRIVADAAQRFPQSGELQFIHAAHLRMMGRSEEARLLLHVAACRVVDPGIRAFARKELGTERLNCVKPR